MGVSGGGVAANSWQLTVHSGQKTKREKVDSSTVLPTFLASRLPSWLRVNRARKVNTASGRPLDYVPFILPFEAQGKQGKQCKQFKVEEGKIRRGKRSEALGVNSYARTWAGLKVGFNTEDTEYAERSGGRRDARGRERASSRTGRGSGVERDVHGGSYRNSW
jgi:hypothetical protein